MFHEIPLAGSKDWKTKNNPSIPPSSTFEHIIFHTCLSYATSQSALAPGSIYTTVGFAAMERTESNYCHSFSPKPTGRLTHPAAQQPQSKQSMALPRSSEIQAQASLPAQRFSAKDSNTPIRISHRLKQSQNELARTTAAGSYALVNSQQGGLGH